MKEWYPTAHKSGHKLETLLPESYSESKTIKKIIRTSKIEVG